MGDINQYAWINKNKAHIKEPVLEIGARHYSKDVSINYREICTGMRYIGTDMQAGKNVDKVIDFTQDISIIRNELGEQGVKTVIFCSVLEHVDNAAKMAENITKVLNPGGVLFISVPFTWRFHGYPSDYWRFTPEGIKQLFPDFTFDVSNSMISSNKPNDFVLGDTDINQFIVRSVMKEGRLDKFLRKIGLRKSDPLTEYSYVLIPSMISMIGIKK